ncbi:MULTISPECIES: thioredoxin family protein [Thiomicrorhabdus]|uniref:Thioredoxin fold domain-containing protein n=1 Tax=Thiomicrorhabdus heinhorstiae TaxID=2748010 RepID=A0ABS0BY20_9GAMM|nr:MULTISPECIES: thioredoxin fold domain-containing protein [Thiomicrorhabdus]MBF6057965.1 thioredoxin fold domain-containing protein [Thiomicrorhabdus heinhorstiae]
MRKLIGLIATLMLSSQAFAGGILPLAVDLQKTAKTAEANNVPIVIFATATWCNYCRKLEENILYPLLETTPIEQYAEFRQLILDKDHWQMRYFDGTKIEMKTLGPKLGVKVAPTTMFFNSKGEMIADPIIGLTLEEFYPGNLEKGLNQALKALNNPKRVDVYKMVEESDVNYKIRANQ